MKLKFLALLTAFSFLFSFPTFASEKGAFNLLSEARGKTHSDGPFRLRGEETSVKESTVGGKTSSVSTSYQLSGYDYRASETYMKLVPLDGAALPKESSSESFLITPGAIYTKSGKPSGAWAAQDLMALLPKFAALGTLDQFFMLELLNGDRLNLYADYMTLAPDAVVGGVTYKVVGIKLSRDQFSKLAEVLTSDIKTMLGAAADSMTEAQLKLIQTLAKGTLQSLDAEMSYKMHIDGDGRIARVTCAANMANPFGEAGAVSRIKTSSSLEFFDFGKEIIRAVP